MANKKLPKSEKQYVRGIIHNLSLQRWTDQEITDYLNTEHKTMLSRSAISHIRTQIEKSAEKWYINLKQSRYKYIANYKERLDSLLSYQRRLNEIVAATKKDEVKIRAISELHSIEKTIFDLWKQLPTLDISNQVKQEQQEPEGDPPIFDVEDINGVEELPDEVKGMWHNFVQCDHCKRWWKGRKLLDYHKKKSNNACAIPNIE